MRKLLLIALLPLAGCGIQMRLLDDGRIHEGHYSPGARSMDVTIDGTTYTGSIMQGTAIGFGSGFVGGRSFTTTSIGISTAGQSTMMSADGRWVQCQFNAAAGSGMGQCQDSKGKLYGMVIGRMPTDPAPADACPPGRFRSGGTCM